MSERVSVRIKKFRLMLAMAAVQWVCGIAAQESVVYTNRELGFSIAQPAGWERAENISGAALALTAPPAKNAFRWNVSVIVHDLPVTATLEQFAEAQISGVDKLLNAFAQDEKSKIELGALKAMRVIFHFKQKETPVKCLSVLVVANERGYVLTCSADAAHFDDALKIFDTITGSFKAL